MIDGTLVRASWRPEPAAEAFVATLLASALERCEPAGGYARRLLELSAVRLRDVVDHLSPADATTWRRAHELGWRPAGAGMLRHADGLFPDLVDDGRAFVAIRTESVEQLLAATGSDAVIEGAAHGPYRRARVFRGAGADLVAVERNGHASCEMPEVPATTIRAARVHLQRFRARRRQFDDVPSGLDHTERLVDAAVAELGPHWACDLFFRAEREYWQAHCAAARLQHARQWQAGIGWANVDHHTYDASRIHFAQTIRVLETLGYQCRELLYAGHQAGWGSQILEQPVLRSTIFADIDLAPHELDIDFAHRPMQPLERHRRAGLWCVMHGESMLEAGLNHVAGLHDQRALRAQFAGLGQRMMAPFSDFPVLYQELTEGEWRAVDPDRIDALERDGQLDAAEAEDFRSRGAICAHYENIERNDGFKGFNRPGIDGVLSVLDPRRNLAGATAPRDIAGAR